MLTKDSLAKSIFEEVRDQPYRVSEHAGDDAANCASKGKQLLDRLGFLGFGVRGRIGEMRWQDRILVWRKIGKPQTISIVEVFERAKARGLLLTDDDSVYLVFKGCAAGLGELREDLENTGWAVEKAAKTYSF